MTAGENKGFLDPFSPQTQPQLIRPTTTHTLSSVASVAPLRETLPLPVPCVSARNPFSGIPHATPPSPQRPRNTTTQHQPILPTVASFAPLRETLPPPRESRSPPPHRIVTCTLLSMIPALIA
jgi:hypothetical protein